jgi:predicted transposase YbfD/YdcC
MMKKELNDLFIKHFSCIKDPRIERCKRHLLLDILVLSLCAVMSGAEQWIDIEAYGQEKEAWLKTFLELPNGIPSHDTIARVFASLEPTQFQHAFLNWIQAIKKELPGEVIAIDGKTLRGSRCFGKKGLHLVSAWATEQHLSLGQLKVDSKTNEITVVPELLKLLMLKDAIVTLDAMGCQRTIAKQIKSQGANYVLAVKENQERLYKSLQETFLKAEANQFNAMTYSQHETVEGDHGRIETRRYTVLPLMYLHQFKCRWSGLQSLVQVENHRQIKGGEYSVNKRYYISSLPMKADLIAKAIRAHWRIENNLHWSLDVIFKEDQSRIRKAHAPENVGWLRRFALSLLKKESSIKASIRRKRFKALMDNNYLISIFQAI